MACDFACSVPFDVFNDILRGLINTSMDMLECPDELLTAIAACTKIQVRALRNAMSTRPVRSVMYFIHNGMDNFMSMEQFQTFYWPGLKALLDTVLEMGGIPHIYLEENYKNKLDFFTKELPPGKVTITFINTDMEKAKEKLSGRVCISGGMDGVCLQYGTAAEVVKHVKRTLDVCAPGGGYIMGCNVSLNLAKPENLRAMYDTARTYRKN